MLKSERPLILSIETATRKGSVALQRGAHLLAARQGDGHTSHSTILLRDLSEVLTEGEIGLREIDLFAVAAGPGSFTGLRIGLATVKSLAQTLRRPCLGVPTLHAVAHAAGASKVTVALLPAGRGEVFAQLLSVDDDGTVEALDEAVHVAPGRLLEKMKHIESLKWAGEGALLYSEAIRDFASRGSINFQEEAEGGGASESDDDQVWTLAATPSSLLASDVAALALRRFEAGEMYRPEDLRAIYVRPSDAELKEQCLEPRPQSV